MKTGITLPLRRLICFFIVILMILTTFPSGMYLYFCEHENNNASNKTNVKASQYSNEAPIAVPLVNNNHIDLSESIYPNEPDPIITEDEIDEELIALLYEYIVENYNRAKNGRSLIGSKSLKNERIKNLLEVSSLSNEEGFLDGENEAFVDLDVDSDNDNGTGYPARTGGYTGETGEDGMEDDGYPYLGKYIVVNDDDDNRNRTVDLKDKENVSNENDLVPLILEIDNGSMNLQNVKFQITLNVGDTKDIGLWASPRRIQKIQFGTWYNWSFIIGDMNIDGKVDFGDINPFVLALSNPTRYQERYGIPAYIRGDINQDGICGFGDINPFVMLLSDPHNIKNWPKTANVNITLWIEGLNSTAPLQLEVKVRDSKDEWQGPYSSDQVKVSIKPRSSSYYGNDPEYNLDQFCVPNGYKCEDKNFLSRSWSSYWTGLIRPTSSEPAGFPLQLSLIYGFGPGDFPPMSLDPAKSTVPLVSKETDYFQGPNTYMERPAQNELIDLVTGVPLYQETDFELPFGGATFRHIRTYSENILNHVDAANRDWLWGIDGKYKKTSLGSFWDWNGKFWMMSENPILLIDAAYPKMVSEKYPKFCYFIPDAHHAIPFAWEPSTNSYVAPLWFDAVMAFSPAKDAYTGVPDYYYIWLNHGSIKYTFKSYAEDVWIQREVDGSYTDVHNSPLDQEEPGYGIPFYGLVTNITDRFGNRIEYEYCPFTQYADDDDKTEECVECAQNSNEKGQLKAIKLVTADNDVIWTVLYTYRGFSNSVSHSELRSTKELFHPHKVHSIHVYNRNIDTSQYGSLTIGFWGNFSDMDSFDAYDDIDAVSLLGLPPDWVIEVKYLYEESQQEWYESKDPDSQYYKFWFNKVGAGEGPFNNYNNFTGYNLLKTTITNNMTSTGGSPTVLTSKTIYRYYYQGDPEYKVWLLEPSVINGGGGLKAIYYNPTIEKIVNVQQQFYGTEVTENVLFTLADSNRTVPNDSYRNGISLWENTDGTGMNLTEETVGRFFIGVSSVNTSDMDSDDDIDILAAACLLGQIAWWENKYGDGKTWIKHVIADDVCGVRDVCAVDVDQDNDVDVVAAVNNSPTSDMIYWWENLDGAATTWEKHVIASSFEGATAIHPALIDDDQWVDILGAGKDGIAWWKNLGNGISWQYIAVDESFTGACSVYTADIDNDKDVDVLGASPELKEIAWWQNNNGLGTEWSKTVLPCDLPIEGASSVYAKDIDNDQDIDILGAARYFNSIICWINTNSGTSWELPLPVGSKDFTNARTVYASDLNNDSWIDVLATAVHPTNSNDRDIAWWMNQKGMSPFSWSEHVVDVSFNGSYDICSADLDGDHDQDIVAAVLRDDMLSLIEGADIRMSAFPMALESPYSFFEELVKTENFVGTVYDNTTYFVSGKSGLVDRRPGRDDNGGYHFYQFKSYPIECQGKTLYDYYHTEYHSPYQYKHENELKPLPWDEPFHVMVIDEYDPYDPVDFGDVTSEKILSRRVVRMNPTGFILEDELYAPNETGVLSLSSHMGYAEHHVHSKNGSLLQKRTRGWASDENLNTRETKGFVYNFTYYPDWVKTFWFHTQDEMGNPILAFKDVIIRGELKTIGVQSGSLGDCYVMQYFDRNVKNRLELINRTVQFPTPVLYGTLFPSNLNGKPDEDVIQQYGVTTWTNYTFLDKNTSKCVKEKNVTQPATLLRDGGEKYVAVECMANDKNGNLIWRGYGSLKDPDHVGSEYDYFFIDHYQYDNLGQPTLEVIDIDEYESPWGWRVDKLGNTHALNLKTQYFYDPIYGLNKIIYPNNLEKHIVYVQRTPDILEQWTYDNLLPASQSPDQKFHVDSPVQIVFYKDLWYDHSETVHLKVTDDIPNGSSNEYENAIILSVSTMETDYQGRPSEIKTQGMTNGETVSTKIQYHATGEPARTENPDGTITRNTYTMRGYLDRVYQGTKDRHVVWRTATPEYPELYDDNLRLIEKRYYGNGTHDAGKLVTVRKYLEKPINQYFKTSNSVVTPPNNEDEIGYITNYSYDWRMRQVLVENFNSTGARLSHTFTWYNQLNSVILTATYGSTICVPAGVDPRYLNPDWDLTDQNITDILDTKPVSLVRTCYNARGQVEETRSYNVDSGSSALFLVEKSYYDHNGRLVEHHVSNGPIERTYYDAKGRQVNSSTWADGKEITRIQMWYTNRDQVNKTVQWERKHDATEPILNTENSVKTYSYSWYDQAGRVNCTADYGTNNTTFVTGPEPVYDPLNPPAPGSLGSVRITCYDYDNASRNNATYHPDGTVTRTEYDDLGRTLLTIENADDPKKELRRYTAYYYERTTGRLRMMAAILPLHKGKDGVEGVTNWSDINWSADDDSIQITRFEYNALIINGTWKITPTINGWSPSVLNFENTSRNEGWISKAIYPDGDWLKFTYYADGAVASRTDSKNTTLFYTYDGLGRLVEIWVNDTAYYAGASYAPKQRIQRVTYEYEPDGLTSKVTAYSYTSGSESIVSQNNYTYDGLRNLIREYQSHDGTVQLPGTSYIEYGWEFSDATQKNYNRLKSITYPDGTSRTVTYQYDLDELDNALSRVSGITDSQVGQLSQYDYAGISRRIKTSFGNGVTQNFICGSNEGYAGLDQFGQIIDLHYKKGSYTLHQYQYEYDLAGNRKYSRVTQYPNFINKRSFLYKYDSLHRLINASLGELDQSNSQIIRTNGVPSQTLLWTLDNLGNWAGGNPTSGSMIREKYDGSGTLTETETIHHNVTISNKITNITTKEYNGRGENPPGEQKKDEEIVYGDGRGEIHVYPGQSIQTAINNALPGDIIHVHSGTYFEHDISINQEKSSISLIGENRDNVIIDGEWNTWIIKIPGTDSITIKNFTLQNAQYGIDLFEWSGVSPQYTIIENNKIMTSIRGIRACSGYSSASNNNTFLGNLVSDAQIGIEIPGSTSNDNLICGNIITQITQVGMRIASSRNIVMNNTIIDSVCTDSWSAGIRIEGSLNLVKNNTIRGLRISGQSMSLYGIHIISGDNNNMTKNFISDLNSSEIYSTSCGIFLDSGRNNVSLNSIYWINGSSSPGAISYSYGIYIDSDAPSNNITQNIIRDIFRFGDPGECYGVYIYSDSNTITQNKVCNIVGAINIGIYLHYIGLKFNKIIANTLEDCKNGLYSDSEWSTDNIIYWNNFINNQQHAYDIGFNQWHNGYPDGGNYWDNHNTHDEYYGEDQDKPGSDGIVDKSGGGLDPYIIPDDTPNNPYDNNKDNYPYVNYGPPYPTAIAGGPYEGFTNKLITLDGSKSHEPYGKIIKYEWDFDYDGVFDPDWDGDSSTLGIKQWIYTVAGEYKAAIRVTDDDYDVNINETTVYISDLPTDKSEYIYDRAGNIVFDSDYFYQYDGFNRLVQVNHSGDLAFNSFDENGRIKPGLYPGDLVVRYIYDGLGRLIIKETITTEEEYYYDGVRRIQEIKDEQFSRDYTYGPDYVDEFILQVNETGIPIYMLQDANYNVVALVSNSGDILEQYVYDPYGTIADVDTFPGGETLVNRIGHQGLFFELFTTTTSGKILEPNTVGLYYSRNRWYNPTLGRFIQRDPNDAALPIITACAMNGDIVQLTSHLNIQGQYSDGMNLYQYCSSNPVNNRDPRGLNVLEHLFVYTLIQLGKLMHPSIGEEAYHTILHLCEIIHVFKITYEVLNNLLTEVIEMIDNFNAKGAGQLVGRLFQACRSALSAIGSGARAFINALTNAGRIVSPYIMNALRALGSAGASVLNFLGDCVIAAAPYMAVIGVIILGCYAGYALAKWLGPYIDEIAEALWQIRWRYAQGKAKSIVAPVMQAAAGYRSWVDAFMDEIEAGWGRTC